MTIGREAMDTLIQTYRDKALDTFIRGLRGDLSKLLCIREPTSLPQALHLCLKLQNQDFRSDHALHKNSKNPQTVSKNQNYKNPVYYKPIGPPLQVSPATPIYRQYSNQKPIQFPTQYMPQHFTQSPVQRPNQYLNQYPTQTPNPYLNQYPIQYQYNLPPPRPTAPKPQPRPVPMETETIQTRNVNYMNRPRPNDRFVGKRPSEQPIPNAQKAQRNFNIETNGYEDEEEANYNGERTSYEEIEDLQAFNEYTDQIATYEPRGQSESIGEEEFVDIHFLE